MEKSLLMCDSTEGDGTAEIVMDFVMSYSLRHAVDEYLVEKPMLCRYCRNMLGKLIDVDITDKTHIKSINVWKEWEHIDLCVEVVIIDGEAEYKYAVLVENKYYGQLKNGTLQRYKEAFDVHYKGTDYIKSYKFVSCYEKLDEIEKKYGAVLAKTPEFTPLPFYDLLPTKYWHEDKKAYEDTESEIFNEFWLRKW